MHQAATVSGTEELRRTNLRALLRAVHAGGPMTRADLTRLLGLNRSTIGGLTTTLIELGLVAEAAGALRTWSCRDRRTPWSPSTSASTGCRSP